MSDNPPTRGFGFGSREAPDVIDKYLKTLGFYRKHIPFDSTSLFRVVSEQLYGIQTHHEIVRKDCVEYMRARKTEFEKQIQCDLDVYLTNMSQQRTRGTRLELKALALKHEANVNIFEPLSYEKSFLHNDAHEKLWRVFVGRDGHFDSVYTIEHMVNEAECQSIVYDILYTNVLGLPDVQYAVERMLHDPNDEKTQYSEDEEGNQIATTEDGRQLKLSTAAETECVLMNRQLCHFHNPDNFESIERFFAENGSNAFYRRFIRHSESHKHVVKPNPLLNDRNISCVRQLLNIGITPFPFKVAKALDRNIYRNVEYDIWFELREEKWNAHIFQIENRDRDENNNQGARRNGQSYERWQRRSRRGIRVGTIINPFIERAQMDEVICEIPDREEPIEQHGNDCSGLNAALVPYSGQQYSQPPQHSGGSNEFHEFSNNEQTSNWIGCGTFNPFYPPVPQTNYAPQGMIQIQQHMQPNDEQQLLRVHEQQMQQFFTNFPTYQIANNCLVMHQYNEFHQFYLQQQLQQQQPLLQQHQSQLQQFQQLQQFHQPQQIQQLQPLQHPQQFPHLLQELQQQLQPQQHLEMHQQLVHQFQQNRLLQQYELQQQQLQQQIQKQELKQQQQQQQIVPYVPIFGNVPNMHGYFYNYILNGEETNNHGAMAMTYDNIPLISPPPGYDGQFWPNM